MWKKDTAGISRALGAPTKIDASRAIRAIPLAVAAWLFVVASPVVAGIHYQAVTTVEPETGKGGQVMRVEAWVSGEKAKITFAASDNPLTPQGSYLLTEDSGRTLYLVNPERETYSRWDLDGMLALAGGILQGMRGIGKFEFSEPQVEKLMDATGGEIHGLPTRHYRYRTTYAMDIRILGMGQASEVESVQDIWATSSLNDVALGVWLRKDPPKTGDPGLDKILAAETAKMEGFPLKTVTVTSQRQVKKKSGKVGKETITRTTMEVTSLAKENIADATFALPAGYEEVPMPVLSGEDEDGKSPFKGLLRRRNQ